MDLIFPLFGEARETLQSIAKCNVKSFFLMGPEKSCKTSLLMQAAITEANKGLSVLFVTSEKLANLPLGVHGMQPPSSYTMKNIQFLYVKCPKEFQKYLSSIHLRPRNSRPSLIIVDDIDYYFNSGDALADVASLSKFLALILNVLDSSPETDDACSASAGLVMVSWNENSKRSTVKPQDARDVAKKNSWDVWLMSYHYSVASSKNQFKVRSESGKGGFEFEFDLNKTSPKSLQIFLKNIYIHTHK